MIDADFLVLAQPALLTLGLRNGFCFRHALDCLRRFTRVEMCRIGGETQMGWFSDMRAMNRQAKVAVQVSLALEQAGASIGTKGDWDGWARQFFKMAYAAAPHAFDPSNPVAMKSDMAVFVVLMYPVQVDTLHDFPDQIVQVAAKALETKAAELLGRDSPLRVDEKELVRDTVERLKHEGSLSPAPPMPRFRS